MRWPAQTLTPGQKTNETKNLQKRQVLPARPPPNNRSVARKMFEGATLYSISNAKLNKTPSNAGFGSVPAISGSVAIGFVFCSGTGLVAYGHSPSNAGF